MFTVLKLPKHQGRQQERELTAGQGGCESLGKGKMEIIKNEGYWYWHKHHDKLAEQSGDILERIEFIKAYKPVEVQA